METAQYNITNDRLFFWPEEGTRLPKEEYEACKAAGFVWWPRGCFTCTWRTSAEDWILARGVEIVADDTPDDVESRVERFSGYASKAEAEAGHASARASSATTDRKFEQASRSALREAEQAAYWQDRIAGAIARLNHHDNHQTCANRIKGLGADLRRWQRSRDEHQKFIAWWTACESPEIALKISAIERGSLGLWGKLNKGELDWAGAKALAIPAHQRALKFPERWIAHLQMRIDYETAYLEALGGGALLEPQKRRVTPAPADGLKKGVVLQASAYLRGKMWHWSAPIISLGPKTVTIEWPPEIRDNPSGYESAQKGYQIGRRFAKRPEDANAQ